MKADLHTHTNASDGFITRDKLIDMAKDKQLDVIAITDHDTMKNSFSLDSEKIKVVSACELSTRDYETGARAHVLCYLPKNIAPLAEFFEHMKETRNAVGFKMIELVHKLYPEVTEQSVLNNTGPAGVVFKPNIMQILINSGRTGEVYGELYNSLFSTKNGSCIVKNTYTDLRQILKIIKESRGVAVFAHPSVYKSVALVNELAKEKLIDGVEINHPKNTQQDKLTLAQIAHEHKLIITGGTDFHGQGSKHEVMIGDYLTDEANLDRLFYISKNK